MSKDGIEIVRSGIYWEIKSPYSFHPKELKGFFTSYDMAVRSLENFRAEVRRKASTHDIAAQTRVEKQRKQREQREQVLAEAATAQMNE